MNDPTNADLVARLNMNASQRNIHDETGLLIFDAAAALEQAGKELADLRDSFDLLDAAFDHQSKRADEQAATIEAARAATSWEDSHVILSRTTPTTDAVKLDPEPDKLRIYMNTNITVSRGKYAAHAVHAALTAFGVHPGTPVVVLGAKPRDIDQMRISIHDAGTTELEPGTLTAGTNWPLPDAAKLPEKGEN